MPRGQHPNSLANLKKGKKFKSDDDSARKAGAKGKETQKQERSIAEMMKDKLDKSKREELADALIDNMGKTPQWYELGLRMIGELPSEKVSVSVEKLDTSALDKLEELVLDDKRTGD